MSTTDALDREIQAHNIPGSKAERDLLSYCESLHKRVRERRFIFEKQWYLNLAFYFGKQNAMWTSAAQTSSIFTRLYEPPAPPWRVRLVVNKIRAIVRTELAKVTKERPRGFVIPSTADDDDLAAAKAGEQIFEHLWRELSLHKLVRRVEFWTLLCGTSFSKDFWDKDKVDSSGVKGAISAESVSPFHLFVPDLQEEDIEAQPYVIHQLAKDPGWVKRVFKKDVQPDSTANAGLLEQRFLSALGIEGASKSYVAVKEIWIKSTEKFPNGALIVWAGDKLLQVVDGGLPYGHNEYPFTKFDHIPTGRFYSESTVTDLIPLQKEYNRTRSQIVEAKNRMSKPQLIAPRGSIDPTKVTTEPGLIIFYTPGYNPPTPLPLQNLPNYVLEELDRSQRDMDDVSSQHEVTKGRTPPGVTAATAIAYLQEEDDSKLSATISSLEEGIEKIGRHILNYVKQYWDAERQISVIGENGQYESYAFTKANLNGNTDFRVEAGSATPRSRAAKQAFIMELGKMQWIPPDRALRYLDMAETGRLYEEMQIDVRHAQRENLYLAEGINVPVNSWDEHFSHIMEHDNYRKKQAYEALPDEIKILFEVHVRWHKQVLGAMFGIPFEPGDPRLDGALKQIMMGGGPAALPQGSEAQTTVEDQAV